MLSAALTILAAPSSVVVDRGSYSIHAEVIGDGRPVVAIAGGPGFSGRSVWGIGFGMRESCRTYLFDQLGTGSSKMKESSSALRSSISLDGTIADLEALRKHCGHKKWIVVGQSWGVILALIYASRYPAAVEHLVLTSVPGLGHEGTVLSDNLSRMLPDSAQAELGKIALDQALSDEARLEATVMGVLPYYFYEPTIGLELAKRAPEGLFAPVVFDALAKHILSTQAYSVALSKVSAFRGPVTMIQGHQDPCGAAMPFLLKERYLHQTKVEMLPRCGHFGWIEQRDLFFEAFHRALKLKLPDWLEFSTETEHRAVLREAKAREDSGWPFGRS